jgi:superfamily II DNA or RNA helicase
MAGQFSDFYASLDADSAKRGKQFEHFVKWFLRTDPEWATQVDQVWLWEEWPQRWGADCGIDLVFRHKNGEHWAVQAKCYLPDYDITKHDVDKFLSESNRPLIQHRLLIASTDGIGANAKQVCDAQDKPVIRYLLSDFERALVNYPANMAALPQAKRKARPAPREHQVEAITTVMHGLANTERGQLIMACGTGKTYVTLWLKEALNAQRTLVLVPSLGLLSQLLREWTFAANTPFEVLCVCSDQTVGNKSNDEAIHSVADLAFPVTSDAEEVKRFLRGTGNRVVFSTYQSSSVIVAAQADSDIADFDLAVADEAHRCAGKVGSDFTAILDTAQIRSRKRLFATATPRTYSSTVKKSAEERGVEVVGMDDVAQFGEVLYALPFGKAIENKLLTDYRVVIIGVDDPTIAQWIANRELIATDTGIETDSESLAAQIGLLKAIKDYDLKRVISFHSRVKRAEYFARDIHHVAEWISDEHRPSGTLHTDYVSGDMSAHKRKIKIDQLKTLNADQRGVLSNARCLSEGVDVPSLDGVAFIDPRSSQVDIIQAVGRAIRLSADKKIGTIILPVFIKAGEDAASTIEACNFKPIWEVLNALKAHDDVLACELDNFRTEMGRKSGSSFNANDLNKIAIDLPATVDANFSNALRTYLVEQVTASWNFWIGLFERFVVQQGHGDAPLRELYEGKRLGSWVVNQRQNRDKMSHDRIAQLNGLRGWSWNPLIDKWEEAFVSLHKFISDNGHCRVPRNFTTSDGLRLSSWLQNQRTKKDALSQDRRDRLNVLVGWNWDAHAVLWDEGFAHLQEFVEKYGNGRVVSGYVSEDGYQLADWVGSQRKNENKISQDRKIRLESIQDWNWGVFDKKWEEYFARLQEFVAQHGDCRVPQSYKTSDGIRLGGWVSTQRLKQNDMSPERKARLEALSGWCWDRIVIKWEESFSHLQEFVQREGNSRVPSIYITPDGVKLGSWVSIQRKNRDEMQLERKNRLEALAGWSWDAVEELWEEGFLNLFEFVQKEAHSKVPSSFRTPDGFRLGVWVTVQRMKKNRMSQERRNRLASLAGWVWDVLENQWEESLSYLEIFARKEGHCRVSKGSKTPDGKLLGVWVGRQRLQRESLSSDRKKRLEQLPGWSWDTLESQWEESFEQLQKFALINGHCNVPKLFCAENGSKLGYWVARQRQNPAAMSQDRKKRLEALPGWHWL